MLGCENCNISVNKGKYHVRFQPCDYKYFQKSALRYQHSTRSKITYYCCHFVTYTYSFKFYVKLRFLLLSNMPCGILWHTCFLHPQVSLTQASSSPKQILGFFPGIPSLSFAGARLFIHFVKGWSNPSPSYSPQQFMPYHCYSSCLQSNISYLDSQAFNLVDAPTSSLQVFSSSLFLQNSYEYYPSYKITSSMFFCNDNTYFISDNHFIT